MLQLEFLGTSINNLKLYNTEKVCKEQYNTWNNSQYLKPIINLIFPFMLHEKNKSKHISLLFFFLFLRIWIINVTKVLAQYWSEKNGELGLCQPNLKIVLFYSDTESEMWPRFQSRPLLNFHHYLYTKCFCMFLKNSW